MNPIMKDRQRPLVRLYREEPSAAWVTDVAHTSAADLANPLRSFVTLGPAGTHTLPVAVHTAVGGDGDAPVPGDILAAALASCFDSTLRVVADHLGLELAVLRVGASAEVDVRGTLRVQRDVPVAFQRMTLRVQLELADPKKAPMEQILLQATEYSCVVFQTLKRAVDIEVRREPAHTSPRDTAAPLPAE